MYVFLVVIDGAEFKFPCLNTKLCRLPILAGSLYHLKMVRKCPFLIHMQVGATHALGLLLIALELLWPFYFSPPTLVGEGL